LYERVHNLGNYENERVGIEIELDEGEKADEALRLARIFVNRGLNPVMDENDQTELQIVASQLDAEGV
jgi:hypothetical protein